MTATMTKEEKIDQALMAYRNEHLKGANELTADDWTAIYKKAGMSDEEIAAYRQQLQESAAAVNDPLDAYRA